MTSQGKITVYDWFNSGKNPKSPLEGLKPGTSSLDENLKYSNSFFLSRTPYIHCYSAETTIPIKMAKNVSFTYKLK